MDNGNNGKNKYVGLRYVPLILGEWDIQEKYEPLVVVLHEGNSYTSKTYVPKGVNIDNEKYWVCTGNYNVQVEYYRQEVERLKSSVTTQFNELGINVKSYGVTGDGVTDDTDAIQSCVDNFDYLYFPSGVYVISKTIQINKDIKINGVKNKTKIFMKSKYETTYMFRCDNTNKFDVEYINFESVADRGDGSWFDRPDEDVYSNVRVLECIDVKKINIKSCCINNVESLIFVNDVEEIFSDNSLIIDNVVASKCQMFVFGSSLKNVNISNCIVEHVNCSRFDHSFYLGHDIGIVNIYNIQSYNSIGAAIHLYSVDGFINTFKNAYINNCIIDNGGGGIYVMYGNAYINNVNVKCKIGNSFAIRNKGGEVFVTNSYINSKGFCLYSEHGSGANPMAIPHTIIENSYIETFMIEGFQDKNDVAGVREFYQCTFDVLREGDYKATILTENVDAEYVIKHCSFKRVVSTWTIAFIESLSPSKIEIMNCDCSGGKFTTFNGDATNVKVANNIVNVEKGNDVIEGVGQFVNNSIIQYS